MQTSEVTIQSVIETLATYNATPGNGVTRLSYTPEHDQARAYMIDLMQKTGMQVRQDAVGTIIGRREGTEPGLPAIAIGSHIDTVRNGGAFDGMAGIAAGIAIAEALEENGIQLRHPLEVFAIVEEEGSRFNCGMFGGKVIGGLAEEADLDKFIDDNGISLRAAAKEFGLQPEDMRQAARSRKDMRAFFELHIEQGPVLEAAQCPIGLVDTIVGISAKEYTVKGRADHAGTTPLDLRQDALLAAAEVALAVNRAARQLEDRTVATVGRLQVRPGSINVVPGEVVFSLEMRSRNTASLDWLKEQVVAALESAAETYHVSIAVKDVIEIAPVVMAEPLVAALENAANASNIPYKKMPSGAGHDSMYIANTTDVGMVFVPSRGGRSHCPEEWTDYRDIRTGADVIAQAILELDKN